MWVKGFPIKSNWVSGRCTTVPSTMTFDPSALVSPQAGVRFEKTQDKVLSGATSSPSSDWFSKLLVSY